MVVCASIMSWLAIATLLFRFFSVLRFTILFCCEVSDFLLLLFSFLLVSLPLLLLFQCRNAFVECNPITKTHKMHQKKGNLHFIVLFHEIIFIPHVDPRSPFLRKTSEKQTSISNLELLFLLSKFACRFSDFT